MVLALLSSFTLWVSVAIALVAWYGFNIPVRWKLRKVPGPRPSFLVGNLLDGPIETFHRNFIAWPKRFGRVSKYFLGRNSYILCSDPELIHQVSVKQFTTFHDRRKPIFPPSGAEDDDRLTWEILWAQGKFWSTIRAATDPLFHAQALASYAPVMHSAIEQLLGRIDIAKGAPIEISQPLREMSLQIIGSAAFGVDFVSSGGTENELGRSAMAIIHPRSVPVWVRIVLATFPFLREAVYWYLKHYTTRSSPIAAFFRANGYLIGASKALLRSSRVQTTGDEEPHVLPSQDSRLKREEVSAARQIQLEAQDKGYEDFKDAVPRENSFFHKLLQTTHATDGEKVKLTQTQIIPQAIVFILAGFDTTATNLSFTLFELAKQERIQATIRQEIAAFDSKPGSPRQLGPQHLIDFPYTQACMLESLRLHPPINGQYIQQRIASSETKLGSYRIPKGSTVVFNTHGLAHDAQIYPDPEVFRPERFLTQKDGKLTVEQPASFMSFGIGPHRCIGYKFAIDEGVFALVALHRSFVYRLDADHHGHTPTMDYKPGLVFGPKDGVWLKISAAR